MPAVTAQDHELHQLADELRARNHVLVCWDSRLGGGIIQGSTIRVRMPGERDSRSVSDAEIAVLRMLELQGAVMVTWPPRFSIGGPRDEPHAPIRPDIEAAARAMAAQR